MVIMSREWKDVVGYEGKYMVSNDGLVKSLYRNKIIKGEKTRVGYIRVSLYDKACAKHISVHRLVAEAFIPNPNGYTVVHHLNHDKRDNRAENLAWMSDKEHRGSHAIEQNSKKVYQYTLDGELAKTWDSVADALRNGYCNISRCCCGKSKTANGYRWSYTPL